MNVAQSTGDGRATKGRVDTRSGGAGKAMRPCAIYEQYQETKHIKANEMRREKPKHRKIPETER